MTATPIPRTPASPAMASGGASDPSELPPGRTPVVPQRCGNPTAARLPLIPSKVPWVRRLMWSAPWRIGNPGPALSGGGHNHQRASSPLRVASLPHDPATTSKRDHLPFACAPPMCSCPHGGEVAWMPEPACMVMSKRSLGLPSATSCRPGGPGAASSTAWINDSRKSLPATSGAVGALRRRFENRRELEPASARSCQACTPIRPLPIWPGPASAMTARARSSPARGTKENPGGRPLAGGPSGRPQALKRQRPARRPPA